jgi:hypothetical protein
MGGRIASVHDSYPFRFVATRFARLRGDGVGSGLSLQAGTETVPPSIMFKNLVELADGRYKLKIMHGGLIQADRAGGGDDSQPTFDSFEDGRDELMIYLLPAGGR